MYGFIAMLVWYIVWYTICLWIGGFFMLKMIYLYCMKTLLQSSTGTGVMLRAKSFLLLLVPSAISLIEIITGQRVASDQVNDLVNDLVNAIFTLAFAVIHIYGWVRSIKFSNLRAVK